MRIALVTYNAVGRSGAYPDGWHERGPHRAFLVQNTKGQGTYRTGPIGEEERRLQVPQLWGQLTALMEELDLIVVYVGKEGSENAITLAGQLPPEKVMFVLCDCALEHKQQLIAQAQLQTARQFMCECGGHDSMRRIYEHFLEHGSVPDR